MTETEEQRLGRAGEYLREAEILDREKIGNMPALANLYHAMMNCLFALFGLKEPGNILHADIIEKFKNRFILTGIFNKKYADALDFTFHITHECNCDQMRPPADEDMQRLFPVAKEFISDITHFLRETRSSR